VASTVLTGPRRSNAPGLPDKIIGYLYSTSIPLRNLLGDQRSAFERALTDALQELPDADLVEAVTVGALIATRA
jgi:hypothetical protein